MTPEDRQLHKLIHALTKRVELLESRVRSHKSRDDFAPVPQGPHSDDRDLDPYDLDSRFMEPNTHITN